MDYAGWLSESFEATRACCSRLAVATATVIAGATAAQSRYARSRESIPAGDDGAGPM